jgi:hypothetical protein
MAHDLPWQADIGDAAEGKVPWLERPRVLQRSEGFRKTYDEKQAALIGSGDIGAQGYHPKPAALLLEQLKKDNKQRASVWEVRPLQPLFCGRQVCTRLPASVMKVPSL